MQDKSVTVCCIIGMGGLGKTTLAQMVYNDEHIANHFQLRCWVCVSDHFVLKTLLKSIIESTGGNACDLEDLDPLQCRVQGILSGKKFLLVLDDVWNEDQTKWYKLKSMLTCGGICSSIIVTTRLQSVASMTTTMQILRLEALSEENGWSLFKQYAFEENERYNPMLEEIGWEIVKKCGGVPQDKEDAILPALRLSYNHLPSQLKQCFSYCSIFPKDYEMVKDDLIHLWMANGFLPSKGSMELEDIGNDIFNELLWRSLFQDIRKDNNTDMVYCKMHDLVHDLACSVTVSECTVVKADKGQNAFKDFTRHLSLEVGHSSTSTNISNSILSISQPLLRTFLLIGPVGVNWRIPQLITYSNLECLRVLDLSSFSMHTLHVSIRNLKHLRYLNLSNWYNMRSLPNESICSMRNLQVLKLDHCYNLQVLPENMRKLTNLRHLGIKGCGKLSRMPVGMGNLICLRTLCKFVVVPKSGRGISELHGLDHLTRELTIRGLEHVRNSKDAKSANLMRKKNISDLTLAWSKENNSSTIEEDKEVASIGESLQPHSNIKRLYINYYNGLKFPSWMSRHSCLPNLVVMSIRGWRRCENLPSLGNLPLLESLEIGEMDSLKCIGDEFYGDHHHGLSFPALKKLQISGMPNLEDWSSSSKGGVLEEFPSLEVLRLHGCPELRTLPRLPSFLKEFRLECNEMTLERILENVSLNSSSLSTFAIRFDREFICTRRWAPGLRKLACLQSLEIGCCHKMKTLPKELLENLPTLTDLIISDHAGFLPKETSGLSFNIMDCKELVCLPKEMQKLTSLQYFNLVGCSRLKSLPELGSRNNTVMTKLLIQRCDGLTSVSDCLRHLTTLEDLVINGCPELEFLQNDFQDLSSLRGLKISSLAQMTCLPEGLQQVAGTLESILISNCPGMTSLPEWMDKFTSLQDLSIDSCENLKVLPEEVQHLTALKDVSISNCHPDLHRRYMKETGEDWHKIAHIPNLHIPCYSSSSNTNHQFVLDVHFL